MGWKSSAERYGTVAIAIHWITAVAILWLLVSGFLVANAADPEAKAGLLRIHAAVGISVLVLTLLRLLWWWLVDKRPADVAGLPRWRRIGAHAVHGLLYLVILVMALSGIGMVALSGAGDVLFAGAAAPLPDFTLYPPRIPHGVGGRLMLVLLVLHVGAALHHQFVRRDRLLARMGIGR